MRGPVNNTVKWGRHGVFTRGSHSGALPLAKKGHADGPKVPDNDVIGTHSVSRTPHAAALQGRPAST